MEIHGPMVWSADAIEHFDLNRIRCDLQASGMRCAGIYTPGWGGRDAADVEAHAQAIAACAQFARELGASHITSTGASPRDEPGALERVITCVRRVTELVPPDNSVRLALEPHFGNVLLQPDDFDRIFKAVPDTRLGVCVDTGHFHSAGIDTIAIIHRFAKRIVNVHLKDHISTVSVGIGRGEIDLQTEIAALRETGYPGDLTVELEVEDPLNLPRYTQEAYVYLCGLLGRKL